MQGFLVTNKKWVQIQIPAGVSYLIPQDDSSFYYSETPQTDADKPYKNNSLKTFSSPISLDKKTQSVLYVLSTSDEAKLILEQEICPM